MDKRFWSGAVAVVTVVIAGAGVLPSLLLRPAVDDDPMAGSVEPAPFISKPVKLVDYEPPRPVAAGVSAPVLQVAVRPPEPKPAGVAAAVPVVQVAAMAPAAPAMKAVSDISAAAVASVAVMTTAAVSASAPSPAQAAVAVFPPIQPVGFASPSGVDAKPKVDAATPPREAVAKPVRQVREKTVRHAASRERAKPRRTSRPAPFPIRQFLAALRR